MIYNNKGKYIEDKNEQIENLVKRIEGKVIDITDLEDELLNELICYYTKQICLKKKQINFLREKIKNGKIL